MQLLKRSQLTLDLIDLQQKIPRVSGFDSLQTEEQGIHLSLLQSHKQIASLYCNQEGNYSATIRSRPHTKNIVFLHIDNATKQKLNFFIEVQESSEIVFVTQLTSRLNAQLSCNLEVSCQSHSVFSYIGVHMNSGLSNFTISSTAKGNGVRSNISSVCLGKNDSQTDVQIQNISAGNSNIGNIQNRAILLDSAVCGLQGIPFVGLGKTDNNYHLDQKTLLLSPRARIISRPLLSIANNQVSASHSDSVSSIHPEDLFYLQSRGLSKTSANKLIVHAFINELLQDIPSQNVQKCLQESVNECIRF